MPEYRRANIAGGTYFFTVITYRRRPILTEPAVRMALREAISVARAQLPFIVDAWVLLPDHLHCIWTLPPGDANFGLRWALIKRHVSKQCEEQFGVVGRSESRIKRDESTIWQRRFWEHLISDDEDFIRHADYLHYNPVKHGHVKKVGDWPYSTFHRFVQQGIYPGDWGGSDDTDTEVEFGE
jgi:putative transposase